MSNDAANLAAIQAAEAATNAAKAVAEVAAKAAQALASANTDSAKAAAVVGSDINYIKQDIAEIKGVLKELSSTYVTKGEFAPVKAIAFGLVGLILVAVVGAILSLVVIK